eukprot:TRINITY_DN92768_c0_g1_i1.p1 TRINITY_DN92768_c0_g1~~TRINITY_DN92768_c0_g1_i1.p1  ORF type:complete len:397 (-),score=54.22 TRINITY_DN92768_c0_g1_i1:55-1245(-)
MQNRLLADDGYQKAREYASSFGRRAVVHVLLWVVATGFVVFGIQWLQGHSYKTSALVIKVLLGFLIFYFLLTLLGLYIRCKGAAPLDRSACLAEGAKLVQTGTGRWVEYFVWGSERPDAMWTVVIHGSASSAKLNKCLYSQEVLERLNVRAIAPSLPGHGYSDPEPNRRMAHWPADDLTAILKAENVNTFMVQGWSYGTAHAMATASYFPADKCLAMGLNCPYLPRDLCRELGLTTDADMVFTEAGYDSPSILPLYAVLAILWSPVVSKCGYFLSDTKLTKTEEPVFMQKFVADVKRSAIRGVLGQVNEMVNQETNQVWPDPRGIQTKCIAVWYAEDDSQCPVAHGRMLAEHFEAKGVKTANRCVNCQWGHFSYVKAEERENGIMTKALLELLKTP